MNSSAFLQYLIVQPGYRGQIAHIEHIPPRQASYGELDHPLAANLQQCLNEYGLLPLYTHQAEAVNIARNGGNVMVATSSASGKSLCYNIAVLEAILAKKGARALYLFPTKALAQDQLRGLDEMCFPELRKIDEVATFDCDTPPDERAEI